MRVLMIDNNVRAAIKGLKEQAAKNPIPINRVVERSVRDSDKFDIKLSDFTPEQRADANLAAYIEIPDGFKVAYSVEEQPVGMCGHLSISINRRGKLPNLVAVETLAFEFDIDMKKGECTVWLEEFEPGWQAVNVVGLIGKRFPEDTKAQ